MQTILSNDGTPLAVYCSGDGTPLILVQGTGAAKPDAWPAFPALQEHLRIYTYDRRGRGRSGDAQHYDISREFEDVVALVDAVAEINSSPVDLLGHSFGGLLALEAGLRTDNIRKLIFYEPAIVGPHDPPLPDGYLDRLDALLDDGDLEGILFEHYTFVGLTAEAIAQLRAMPAWQERLDAAATIPRELRVIGRYTFDAPRFQKLHVPSLLMVGGASPPPMKTGAELVHAALPDSRITVLHGQEHICMYTAPALFTAEIRTFLNGS